MTLKNRQAAGGPSSGFGTHLRKGFVIEQGVIRQAFKPMRPPRAARTDYPPRRNKDTGDIRAKAGLTGTAAVGGRPAVAAVGEPAADVLSLLSKRRKRRLVSFFSRLQKSSQRGSAGSGRASSLAGDSPDS